ncbi:MAG: hypothetical protein M0Z34_02185 [Nitrospiraceae bacterium]|nr:hypothetical protein [Nitrospiraceae bacterium]
MTPVTTGALPPCDPGEEQLKAGATVVGGAAVVAGARAVVTGAAVVGGAVVVTIVVVGSVTVVMDAEEGAEAAELAPPTVVVAPAGADVEEVCDSKPRTPATMPTTTTAATTPPIALFLATLRRIISTATVRHPATPYCGPA